MIYLETILDDLDTFRLERQKDSPEGKWYSVALCRAKDYFYLTDNKDHIHDLPVTLKDSPKKTTEELKLEYTKENIRIIRKLVKKAIKLGWFN